MPLSKEKIYRLDDIYSLPEGQRAELIDGQIYYMAPPGTAHQRISTFLHGTIFNYINSKNGSCEVFHAPFAVFLQAEDKTNDLNYLEPDLLVICDKNKLDGKGCHGAPDWTLEIVSPSSRQTDYYKKLSLYQSSGVREYWIIDPAKEVVIVYDLANQAPPVIYRFNDSVKSGIFEDLTIDFSQLKL
ncbi:Uma2 family endonuclease [Enterocloster lavalensis]|uniref:Uma2 family endonuclease n=1 Tax=Enterocloster lavalensis TaxID=460384 RepID=UPI001D06012D|nr:Uma2 family endonuclease [Enterocloster lavalensis]MCB6346025.1 Uma2 family endonuclease [Enterocloster lavalensis]